MTDLRAAAQQALEALEWHYRQGHSNTLGGFRLKIDEKALRKLRAALAEPVQEPVAWQWLDTGTFRKKLPKTAERCAWNPLYATPPKHSAEPVAWKDKFYESLHHQDFGNSIPLYAAPPQRSPLTDEEISSLWDNHIVPVFGKNGINPIVFARAIEQAHGIKEKT